MDPSDDSSSETSDTVVERQEEYLDEALRPANEIIEDLTTETDAFLSDESSLKSLNLNEDPPVIKPRPYQLEMLEESLKRNVIVAVSAPEAEIWIRLIDIQMDTGSGKTHM